MRSRIDVIKGNASEVARVSGESVKTRGVDATEVGGDLALLAEKLAAQRKATVVITGKVDIVTDGKKTYLVQNGHTMMTHVVGTGCMAASVIGAFAAVERDLSPGGCVRPRLFWDRGGSCRRTIVRARVSSKSGCSTASTTWTGKPCNGGSG